jgi:hypothetical protein
VAFDGRAGKKEGVLLEVNPYDSPVSTQSANRLGSVAKYLADRKWFFCCLLCAAVGIPMDSFAAGRMSQAMVMRLRAQWDVKSGRFAEIPSEVRTTLEKYHNQAVVFSTTSFCLWCLGWASIGVSFVRREPAKRIVGLALLVGFSLLQAIQV